MDTGGKDIKICRSIPAASFPAVFAPRVAVKYIYYIKIQMGPIGGLVEFWCKFVKHDMQQFPPVLFRLHITLPCSNQSCGPNYQALLQSY